MTKNLKILIAVSEKLWQDKNDNKLSEKDYLKKVISVHIKINEDSLKTKKELEDFVNNLGYSIEINRKGFFSFEIKINEK